MENKKQGGANPSLLEQNQVLEFELDSEASVEGPLVTGIGVSGCCRRPDTERLAEISIRYADGALRVLVYVQQCALIGEVEQICRQADLSPLGQADRVV